MKELNMSQGDGRVGQRTVPKCMTLAGTGVLWGDTDARITSAEDFCSLHPYMT
jgi:hypothetical protein